jgi:hypothetical protein
MGFPEGVEGKREEGRNTEGGREGRKKKEGRGKGRKEVRRGRREWKRTNPPSTITLLGPKLSNTVGTYSIGKELVV